MQYSFGGDTNQSYEQLQRKRAIANAMMQQQGTPKNVGEGINSAAQSIAGALIARKADKQDTENRDQFNSKWSNVAGALMGGDTYSPGNYTPPSDGSPEMVNTDQGDPRRGMFATGASGEEPADMRSMIVETANSIGMDPFDLATIMSYETAGTFDPVKAGPTTQHGQHRGLIQFGEPQAKQYGVDWENPVTSQLGEGGAVAKYFTDNGYQPGMGLLDAYSIVNAGAPGRYNASDANNGGAPGTVRDKVMGQMEGHRANAAKLLGGEYAPGSSQPGQPSQAQVMQMVELASSPYASEGQKAVAQAMLQRQMQANDPMRQLQMEKLEADIAAAQNPVQKPTGSMREYEMAKQQGFQGSFMDYQKQLAESRRSNTSVNVNTGGLGPELGKLSTDFGYVLDPSTGQPKVDPETGLPTAAPVPGSPAARELEANENAANERGSQAGRAANIVLEDIDLALGQSDEFGTTGMIGSLASNVGGTAAHDLENTLRTIQANIGFDRLQQMREASPTGGALGAVSERELTELQAVMGSVKQSQSKEQLQRNLTRLKGVYRDILAKADAYPNAAQFGFGGADGAQTQPQDQGQPSGPPEGIDPADWEFMTPEERALFQ